MKIFTCQTCAQVLFFENTSCERCGSRLGYLPERETLSSVAPQGLSWVARAQPKTPYRFCANWEHGACNWMVAADDPIAYCRACRHNRSVPNLGHLANKLPWQRMEEAKRRLFYSVIKFGLPLTCPGEDRWEPLVFDILSDAPNQKKIITGHDNGVITISLEEADDAKREALRSQMAETYRTLLGHFRHEVGHYYWDILVRDEGKFDAFRSTFGDERESYEAALAKHYSEGAPLRWHENFVSAYATTHPWEDFAETWAHYIHMVDTLEMAYAFGLSVSPRVDRNDELATSVDKNPYRMIDIKSIVDAWVPVTIAVNNLNRSMGQPDLYPFVLSPAVVVKLDYIHQLIRSGTKFVTPMKADSLG